MPMADWVKLVCGCVVWGWGGVKLYPTGSISLYVFLPWMIILPVGKTKACCATSWHGALPSFRCHLLPSPVLPPLSLLPGRPPTTSSLRLRHVFTTKEQCSVGKRGIDLCRPSRACLWFMLCHNWRKMKMEVGVGFERNKSMLHLGFINIFA